MKKPYFSVPRFTKYAPLYCLSTFALLFACSEATDDDTVEPTPNDDVLTTTQTLNISYTVPGDLPADASMEDLAIFAWNEFFALNWESSFATDNNRTTPNKSWDFATSGAAPATSVWETYIHRTELRPANGMRTADLSTGLPQYSFINPLDSAGSNIDINDYWVNLDEDNEIGSCYLFAPRNPDTLEVLYMAKSNLVEYNYVKNNFPTDGELYAAAANVAPVTSIGADGKPYMTHEDSIATQEHLDYLKWRSLSATASCNTSVADTICLPCGTEAGAEGSIEIKAAFRMLGPGDDATRFMTKEVVYYKNSPGDTTANGEPTNSTVYTGTMALIGLHIIHKTQNYPDFIFASWEQVDVRNIGMQTIGLDPTDDQGILEPVYDRDPADIPTTLQNVNTQAHTMITTQNPHSVWQYYDLIGVQATPIDYADRATDDNYFMANYVIESDYKLTEFHGSFADPFNSSIKNTIWKGNALNMGGCQGCHGQAQTAFGTDFSFLLDSGAGKPVPNPDPYQTLQEALSAAQPK